MSYTPETLEATLQKYDEIVKKGIVDGDILKVMKDIDSEIVCYQKNMKTILILLNNPEESIAIPIDSGRRPPKNFRNSPIFHNIYNAI